MATKRKAISLETKYEMIQMRNRDEKPSNISKHFDIKSSSTVSTILVQSAKIIAEYEGNINENGAGRNQTKRIKLPTYNDVDAAIEEWFIQKINQPNVVIGCPEIKANKKNRFGGQECDRYYINKILPYLLAVYDPRDVFDADERALFYRAQPAKTMISLLKK